MKKVDVGDKVDGSLFRYFPTFFELMLFTIYEFFV